MINSKSQILHAFEPVQFNLFLHYFCIIFYLFSYRILAGHFLDVVSLSKLLNHLVTFNSYLCIITNRGNQLRNDFVEKLRVSQLNKGFPTLKKSNGSL